MRLKRLLILMFSLVLVFAFAGTAFAQEDETPEEETCGDPIASLFDAYYSADTGEGRATGIVDEITETSITIDGIVYLINEDTEMVDEVVAADEVTVDYITDENEDLVATRVAVGAEEAEETTSICDEVTEYHEEGMGWGVLVKLYAIAAESLEACDGETDCGVTVEELAEMFNSGMGMGQLFNEYGKPAQLGVGHLRKAVCGNGNGNGKNGDDEGDDEEGADTSQAQGNGNGKDNGNGKGKGGNGQGKGHNKGADDPDSGDTGEGDEPSVAEGDGEGNGKGKGKGKSKGNNAGGKGGGGDDDTVDAADSHDGEGEEGEGEEGESEEDDVCAQGDDDAGDDDDEEEEEDED